MNHSDWADTTLGEIATFKSGGTPSKQNGAFWGGQHPWISAKDLKTHYLSTSIDTLTDIGFAESKRAPTGSSLVLVRGMTLLKDFPVGYASRELAFNQDIKALVPKPGIEPLFLSYLLVSKKDILLQNVSVAGHGTGKLETGVLKELSVVIPPIAEQTKIAQILSTWDKAIATTERLLANSQQQKQALMQQLLTGQKRFAGFTDEWITVEFDELLGIEIGGTPSRSNPAYWDTEKTTNNRWLSIADLKGNLITDTSEYISDLGAAKSNTKLIPAGTIVMSFKLTIGRRAILAADTYTNEAICAFKIKDPKRLSNDFLFHALCLVNFEKDIDQAVKGKTLNKAKLKQLTLSLPSLLEQQKIAQVLSTTDAEISNLQAQLAKLKLEKKALMQQLLTGQRRVKLDADAAA